MIGFVAPKPSKSEDGQLPFDKAESERVRKEYQKQYSLDGQGGHVAFTHSAVEWVPMTFDIKQLGLLEGTEDDFGQICNAWGHDRDVYSSTKGATFENKAAGLKSTIQNGIQPLADKWCEAITHNCIEQKNIDAGEKIIACYDHLPSMKEDERLAAQGKLYKIQGLSLALGDNVISHEQYAQEADLKPDGTMEAPQKQPLYAGNTQSSEKPV
jgi:hypothetical protein